MPVAFGMPIADDAREGIVAQLTALMAQMVTDSIVPRFAAIYTHHNSTSMPLFPFASVGIERSMSTKEGSGAGTSVGSLSRHSFEVSVRVAVSNLNEPTDEEMEGRLCDSFINWVERTRNWSTSNGFRFRMGPEIRVAMNEVFPDIAARGALISFVVMDWEKHT